MLRIAIYFHSLSKYKKVDAQGKSNQSIPKGSFTYYVITKGEGGFRIDYANVIFALSNAEFNYGRGSTNRQKVIT